MFGRESKAASELAYELGTESTNYWNVVNKTADLYILAVSDIAVEEVFNELQLRDKTIVHTAASVPLDVLKGKSEHYGVLYPLQSLKKELHHLPDIPIIIDASDKQTLDMLDVLAHTISNHVYRANDELRIKLHLAAVMVNNFTNHLFAMGDEFCKKENIEFEKLYPLIDETIRRVKAHPPQTVQTGPAIREDIYTLGKHLQILSAHPDLKYLYLKLSESILKLHQKK